MTNSPHEPFLAMSGIDKRFPGVIANDGVSFDVHRGEVHSLLGENGAGKSTLMKILYGLYQPDSGEIRLNGESIKLNSPSDAINHGIFSPLGIQEADEFGKSIIFLIEGNPGPGLGLLLAYMFFGKGVAKESAASASVIHFFGGIHEIYFPYVLANPRLLLAVIAGGMVGIFTLTHFDAGLVAPLSPGSIFAVLLMLPKASAIGVLLSIAAATTVSFTVAAVLMKTQRETTKTHKQKQAMQEAMQ